MFLDQQMKQIRKMCNELEEDILKKFTSSNIEFHISPFYDYKKELWVDNKYKGQFKLEWRKVEKYENWEIVYSFIPKQKGEYDD